MTLEDLKALYIKTTHPHDLDFEDPGARFVVRLWDGMDGCWTDCNRAAGVKAETALKTWAESTKNGTKKIRFDEIDYYRIFPADTRMTWDGAPGREMFRDDDREPLVQEAEKATVAEEIDAAKPRGPRPADWHPPNIEAEPLRVSHTTLTRSNPDTLYRSICPACNEGRLLVYRDPQTHDLLNVDLCTHCMQTIVYTDTEINGEKLKDATSTLGEIQRWKANL